MLAGLNKRRRRICVLFYWVTQKVLISKQGLALQRLGSMALRTCSKSAALQRYGVKNELKML
ncbi:hypothetical protein, partial [Chromobacterium sp. LK1]|uniref:hypothetical protein n=1 Tax=Chromobacterium sp. LK1 TaxID=1628193 RepID=UPI001E32ACED